MKQNYYRFINKFAHFLRGLLVASMAILGLFLIIFIGRELYVIAHELLRTSITKSNSEILDEIIVFFLFFEFASMIVSALYHHGHTSINFLMGLGVTALLRGLLTAHGNLYETIGNSVAILLLILAMVIFNKHFKDKLM
ncbi:phosphate-starvation-inducible protein PsiE [Lactobacillus pasteurii DSM 23907 = CRBIP 24.76]|uniref:Protein PsiE n=1 Tax=Lactobacillus pasteurii DSM 23907 = CRBIP 24.76 TaxID=1423790 RepID=I7IYG9_9LACO|nr:phosphate-starvation-inducible protein PsiE [Lactobacillus pasteurii]KRK07322.1 phosphate-starvation-inducible protein PsiE [Lactobacillus pasteurii DSM 23907 = CRBIP 24.76]TDG76790.1 hypothetical protein C5L33_001410 [Lactobacillus pasteurii]CCI84467.1 Protein PsiE [Lactobacillus pasteurii DSM 23907 = CRBIP 24.76]